MARHGNHISAMRVDRAAGRVIAYLDNGTVDSAPNLISPALRMPDTVRSILHEDWKFLAAVTAGSFGFVGVVFAAAAAVAGLGDPALAQVLSVYSGS
ncbi:hypothetical protein [Arthrobacter sp. B3I4]|uniref:hypothetical protein n=1 Tax=Arthrobacter sp. B3I4 TaxID=3042267 RepID=UPI00358F6D5A